jgi:hypothetical protein
MLMLSEATTSGTAVAIDTENQLGGSGATWDFTRQMSGDALVPGAVTGERTLVFELRGMRPIGPGKTFSWGSPVPSNLLQFKGQVLGSKRKTGTVHP